MANFSRLGPGDRFRAFVGAQVAKDPARLDGALKAGVEAVGQPRGFPRAQIKNEYETFRMLADDPEGLRRYAGQVLERAARSSGLTVAELKASVADAIASGLDLAEIAAPEALVGADEAADVDHELLAEALSELDALVGLEPLKAYVRELVEDSTWDALMGDNAKGIDDPFGDGPDKKSKALGHVRVAGRPGAGKTTAIGVLGKVYKALGLLSEGHVHKVEAKDLIAEYLGQTAAKTTKAFEKARGGIFFIDDVQTILPLGGSGDRYNKEALDTLLGFAFEEDVLIAVATYPDRMDEFVGYDPGFKSRFPLEVPFPDFSPPQLTEIFERMCHANKVDFSPEALDKVDKTFKALKLTPNFGNARLVENCFNAWSKNLRTRVLAARRGPEPLTGPDAKTLRPEDITEVAGGDLVTLGGAGLRTEADIVAALDEHVVGHAEAKTALSTAVFERTHQRAAGKGTQKPVGFHFFAGPSGVGKTELAKGLAQTAYGGRLETVDCSKLTSAGAVEAFVHGRLSQLDGKSSVVLFDEVEKAHPSLFTHLLRVADEGKLMQMNGDADLSSCHFILTSNLGNTTGLFDDVDPEHPMGEYKDPKAVEAGFAELFAQALAPEFAGRLSEPPIVFRPLGKKALDLILDGTLDKLVQQQAQAYDRHVEVSPKLRKRLVDLGHDPRLGARPMERVVRREVLLPFLRTMVSSAEDHPAGHRLTFDLGEPEAPRVTSAPDPERVKQAAALKQADADAEKALTRALCVESLTALVEAGETDAAAYAEQIGALHAALPKAVDAVGLDAPFVAWMAQVADEAPVGLTQAIAEHAVAAMKGALSPTWPMEVASRARTLLLDDDIIWNDAIEALEPMIDHVGRTLDARYGPAKAELARGLKDRDDTDDDETIRDALCDAVGRAAALVQLQQAEQLFYGVSTGDALSELGAHARRGDPLGGLNEAREKSLARTDSRAAARAVNDATAQLALKWSGKGGRPGATARKDDIWAAFQAQLSVARGAADTEAALVRWLGRSLRDAAEIDDDGLDDAIANVEYEYAFEQPRSIMPAVVEALGIEGDAAQAQIARAQVVAQFDNEDPYEPAGPLFEPIEAFAATRARTDPLGKLLKRLVKVADKLVENDSHAARATLLLAAHLIVSWSPEATPSVARVSGAYRNTVAVSWAAVHDRMDGDEDGAAKLARAWLDAVKETFPAKDADGAWARKAGAQMTNKPAEERLEIFEAAFEVIRD